MPARAYNITLANFSGTTLTLTGQNLCHGEWSTNMAAPGTIKTGQTVTFRTESDGFLTGTEAFVKYETGASSSDGPQTELYIYWDNPYIGTTNAAAFATSGDVPVNGGCSATTPSSSSSSGSTFGPPPTAPTNYQVQPASGWSSGTLSELFPISSGEGEAGGAFKDLAAGVIPVVGIVDLIGTIFGNVGNAPDAVNYFQFSLQSKYFGDPASLRKFLSDRGLNMSKGLRTITINPTREPTISIRRMMGLS
jgi:hypothetical protein